MSEYAVQGPRHPGEIERLDEQTRVPDLPAAAAAHEAPELLLLASSVPRSLLLQRAEGSELSLGVDDLFDRGGAMSADQLVLQVCDAHVEPESFHLGAGEVGAETRPLETALELALLCGVAEARQPDVEPPRAEQIQEASDGLRAPDRDDGDPLGVEIAATAPSERFERPLVADPLDEHDGLSPLAVRTHTRIVTAAEARSPARGSGSAPRAVGIEPSAQRLFEALGQRDQGSLLAAAPDELHADGESRVGARHGQGERR
jgi:hypothetical protein